MERPVEETLAKLKALREQHRVTVGLATLVWGMLEILIDYFEWKQRSYLERMSPPGSQPKDPFT